LLETGVDFEHRIIDLGAKPDDFVDKYRQASGSARASGLVPLLEYKDDLVIESEVVAQYVAQHIAETDELYPDSSDPAACQRMDDFLSRWHPVVDKYYHLLRATSTDTARKREQAFAKSLISLEEAFPENGDCFLGESFSLAECICAPWVQRFFVTLPYFRGIDFETKSLSKVPRVARWMKAVCLRPSVLESKCPEDEMLAAARRYYVSWVSPDAPGRL
jgi:glutathione S-transferase